MKVAVAGGGVIGASIAYHLAKGRASVTLIERGELGAEASGASAGMLIAPLEDLEGPLFRLQDASLQIYPALLDDVQRESGIDVQCTACGIIRTTRTEGDARLLRDLVQSSSDRVNGLTWLDRDALRALEPELAGEYTGAAFSPNDRQLNPGLFTTALARAAERHGGRLMKTASVTGFLRHEGRVHGVSTNVGEVAGLDAVVIAAGPWTEALCLRLGVRLPTPPMRGQMVAYRSDAVKHTIWGENGYLVPKPDGLVYAGSTVEDVGFRKTTTARGLSSIQRSATALVPALRDAPVVRTWAGLRPGALDGLPTMGLLQGTENAYVATGHFRNGILLAPITGRLVSQIVLGEETDVPLGPFAPERFG